MKYLKPYKIYESLQDTEVSIDEFLEKVGIPESKRPQIINWWNENRRDFIIHYFNFSSPQPIAGVFLGENIIAINSRLPMPPHIKLFLALHESRHCDQHKEGRFMEGYYNTVVNGDKESFLQTYTDSERDANDFAVQSMRDCGFDSEMNFEEMRLRGNERAGDMVYRMMSNDIERLNPVDFFDLLKKQIGV
jgi:hypothetical protein